MFPTFCCRGVLQITRADRLTYCLLIRMGGHIPLETKALHFSMSVPTMIKITCGLPLFATLFCVVWSLMFDFEASTRTHCKVFIIWLFPRLPPENRGCSICANCACFLFRLYRAVGSKHIKVQKNAILFISI